MSGWVEDGSALPAADNIADAEMARAWKNADQRKAMTDQVSGVWPVLGVEEMWRVGRNRRQGGPQHGPEIESRQNNTDRETT